MTSSPRIRSTILLALLLALAMLALAGCSQAQQPATGTEKAPEQAETTPQAEPTPAPGEEPLHTSTAKVTGNELAVVKTSKGTITFKFFAKDAPNTVASFIELADKGFYNGTKWHRVVNNPGKLQIAQGGDPLSKTDDPNVGIGGPGWRLKAEFNKNKHLAGTVAMARSSSPDSAGSQFYICLAPQPFLDGQYTVFGQVVSGLDVVQKIAQGDVIQSIAIQHGK